MHKISTITSEDLIAFAPINEIEKKLLLFTAAKNNANRF